ncbi:hypothetical protein K474DRAFT_1665432 [Panus rudis PR-1116 ss-1]|nr:hypothetical protein K474DRAFT_1665432 [Panus rudis PR-1116 ss-1]
MHELLRQILCCCRARSNSLDEPDETTPFIRPTNDVVSQTNPAVDHQKLRERLGTIVRSKEGKMVNVNAPLPFNLHNRSLHAQLEPSSSRSARSLSAQRSPPRLVIDQSEHGVASEGDSPYSYSGDRDDSPSLQTSRSTTSLQPGDASYLPPEADPENGNRRPILNARIVRGAGGFATGGRVGRSIVRGRMGRFEEQAPNASEQRPSEENNGAAGTGEVSNGGSQTDGSGSSTTQSPGSQDGKLGHSDGELPTTPTNFLIQQVGKIARSWSDEIA